MNGELSSAGKLIRDVGILGAVIFTLLWIIHVDNRHNDMVLTELKISVDNNTQVIEQNNQLLVRLQDSLRE